MLSLGDSWPRSLAATCLKAVKWPLKEALVYRQYEDKQGQNKIAAEIVTQEMLMLDRVPQES